MRKGLIWGIFVRRFGKSALLLSLSLRRLTVYVFFDSYAEGWCTDAEIASLPPRLQEQVKRIAAARQGGWAGYYTPAAAPTRHKRYGWIVSLPPTTFFH
jgi:hypothetical protein